MQNTNETTAMKTANSKQEPSNFVELSHSFEDHLYQLIVAAHQATDPKETRVALDIVRDSIRSRLEVIVAAKDFVKLMLSGNAAATVLLIAFIYEHKAISSEFLLVKFLVVISSITLLVALFLTFAQFARHSSQEQIQKWRIALANAENWDMLIMNWQIARSDPKARDIFSSQQTYNIERMILLLWAVGGASVVIAWVVSFL